MSTDGKIYIVITDKAPSETGGSISSSNKTSSNNEKKDTLFNHWARDKLLGTIRNTGIEAVNYSLSNIGNFTGDYITQTHVNDALNNVNGVIGIGMSALAGFQVGGPMGAIIGASLSVINKSVSTALNIKSQRIQNNKTNYEIEQLRMRAGLNSLYDGSRGTEN